MKIIVGLGNPGKEHEATRHNAGFMFLDKFVSSPEIAPVDGKIQFREEKKFQAEIAETIAKGEKLILVKPLTFMNASGTAVSKIMQFYKADISELIVISDDIDIPIGMARVRQSGSSGGQRGLQNIIDNLGTDQFTRLRIGVNSLDQDRRKDWETTNFVLSKPTEREMPILDETIGDMVEFLVKYVGGKEEIPAHSIRIKFDSI